MRAIAAEYFQNSELLGWPLLALVIFIVVFGIAVVGLVRRGAGAFEEVARLPLEGDRHE